MFDPAAISLTSSLSPVAVPGNGIMLENADNVGDPAETAQTGGFEALLALQAAQAQIAVPTKPLAAPVAPKAASLQAATGKTLPDAAMPIAAIAGEIAGTLAEQQPTEAEEAPVALEFLADPAVLASIFAAPDRLAPLAAQALPTSQSAAVPQTNLPMPAQIAPELAKAAKPDVAVDTGISKPVIAAAVAIAQTAMIDVEPDAKPELPAEPADIAETPVSVAANLQARITKPVRPTAETQEPALEKPVAPVMSASLEGAKDQPQAPDMGDDASPLIARADNAPAPAQEAAPVARSEPRAERVDFATLVETLNRAREDASPNTVRVSLNHADFGRVSMRFEQDDKGMSVAMSSADPGFARAVTASNEAATTGTSTDTPRGQSSQANTNGSAQGESNRQQQSQRPATSDRPDVQLRDTLRRKDEPGSASGIFA